MKPTVYTENSVINHMTTNPFLEENWGNRAALFRECEEYGDVFFVGGLKQQPATPPERLTTDVRKSRCRNETLDTPRADRQAITNLWGNSTENTQEGGNPNGFFEHLRNALGKTNRACKHDARTLLLRQENMAKAFPPERFAEKPNPWVATRPS